MPITQQRMLGLLAAAEDLSQALDTAITTLSRESALAEAGRLSAGEALANCRLMLVREALLQQPVATTLVLAAERSRWTPARRLANNREAQAARARRAARSTNNGEAE